MLHSCKKYSMGLICCIIMKDVRSYPLPNGKKPRNHVTMTATISLWGIFSVINDCKPKTKKQFRNYWWWQKWWGSFIKCYDRILYLDWTEEIQGEYLFGVNKWMVWFKQTNFLFEHPLTISAVTHSCSPVFFLGISWKQKHVHDLQYASEDNIAMSQLKAGSIIWLSVIALASLDKMLILRAQKHLHWHSVSSHGSFLSSDSGCRVSQHMCLWQWSLLMCQLNNQTLSRHPSPDGGEIQVKRARDS